MGTIILHLNQTNHQPEYQVKWQIQRPVGEVLEFEIRVNRFKRQTVRCDNDTDRIELQDLSGLFIGKICSNISKFNSCSNAMEITFISSGLKNRSHLPEFQLMYKSNLDSSYRPSKALDISNDLLSYRRKMKCKYKLLGFLRCQNELDKM